MTIIFILSISLIAFFTSFRSTRTCGFSASSLLVVLAACVQSSGNSASKFGGNGGASGPRDYSRLKLAPPPGGGMYVGTYDFMPDHQVAIFEDAIGTRTALFSPYTTIVNQEGPGAPAFFPEEAQRAWDGGYFVSAGAREASPGTENFTVDRLLAGEFDAELSTLAEGFRSFGRPMLFGAAREPNGILGFWQGGFGPDGTESIEWAAANDKGLAEFDPSGFPHAELYEDLGDPNRCDGLERLIAAHRYYHDFMVRREGLDFLTFETMGWAALPATTDAPPGSHERLLFERCLDFEELYPGHAFVDWVTINWYVGAQAYGGNGEAVLTDALRDLLATIERIAPDKPILITELGFADSAAPDQSSAEVLRRGLEELLAHPQIAGFAFWSEFIDDGIPFNVELIPGSPAALAFRGVMAANPSKFHTCVYLTDGKMLPACETETRAAAPAPVGGYCFTDEGEGRRCPTADACDAIWEAGCCTGVCSP